MTAASAAFSSGRNKHLNFLSAAIWATFRAPFIGRKVPSKASSPRKILSAVFVLSVWPLAKR